MTKNDVKKNRRRRRKFLALIIILFTGLLLTATTYAWFTANRTVTVESIDVNVTTSTGLQISTDAKNWKSVITNADITGASWSGVTNQLPNGTGAMMAPVSTVGDTNSTTGFMNMYKGTIDTNLTTGANTLTATKSTETNTTTSGDFVVFDLFFQTNQEQTIYLTDASKVTASANGTDSGIQNASRVAFIVEGSTDYGAEAAVAQALKTPTTPVIWEPNYDVHTTAGVANARDTYGITTTQTGASKIAYNGVKAEITNGVALTSSDANYFSSVTTKESANSGIPSTSYIQLFKIPAGITKVRIYMWVEGQDVDCEDMASGGSLSYNLAFSIDANASA